MQGRKVSEDKVDEQEFLFIFAQVLNIQCDTRNDFFFHKNLILPIFEALTRILQKAA